MMRNVLFALQVFILLGLFSCASDPTVNNENFKGDETNFEQIDVSKSGINFRNDLKEDFVSRSNLFDYTYFYNGGGVAIGDLNNDGLPEVLLTGNQVPNKLYLNKGNFEFEDISEKSTLSKLNRWSTGALIVDINNDGLKDIYISNSGPGDDPSSRQNECYLNKGNLVFEEVGMQLGIADQNYSTQASFFDYDNDGDLDLVVMNHADWFRKKLGQSLIDLQNDPSLLPQVSSHFYKNDNGKFTDVTKEVGLERLTYGLGLVTSDINDDGYVDIYVTNDFMTPDYFFLNTRKGGFQESIKGITRQISWFGMGCDVADVNNDALLDISVVDMTSSDHYRSKTMMPPMNVKDFEVAVKHWGYQYQYMFNSLQINNGNFSFSNVSHMAGVDQTDWSWATLFADFDNDGDKDNIITNGYRKYYSDKDFSTSYAKLMQKYQGKVPENELKEIYNTMPDMKIKNLIYRNDAELTFKEVGKAWDLNHDSYSNGAAYGDLDNDGDLDLIVNNIDDFAFVYKNKTKGNNHLKIDLIGDKGSAILNSKVKIEYGDKQQLLEYTPVRGYQSSVDHVLHFGLGKIETIDKLSVIWPDGSIQRITNVATNQTLKIKKESNLQKLEQKSSTPYLASVNAPIFDHKENEFNDFAREVLLPHKQSVLGPFIDVADINGDGIDDLFVGGAKGHNGVIKLGDKQNGFVADPKNNFIEEKDYEDLGSCFFDIDKDGDLDLYVVSGGNEVDHKSELLKDRLYINDGKGNFKQDLSLNVSSSGQNVKSVDFDQDGDLDLFVGGRAIPGKYPYPDRSFLLENQNGKLIDVTSVKAPDLLNPGIVTDFVFMDINGDKFEDLVLVGEWMPIRFYLNENGKFSLSEEKKSLAGWWYSIEKGDLDNDGDLDLIVGNVGENNKFKPKENKPLHIFCNDFDSNGTYDIVLSKKYKNELVPTRGRECSSEQMPFIKSKFSNYKAFANANLEEMYGEDLLNDGIHLQMNTSSSIILWNNNGNFESKQLPKMCQISPINGFVLADVNEDQLLDILYVGNMFHTEIETARYDAGQGGVLLNRGNKKFEFLKAKDSGFFTPGDAKDIQMVKNGSITGVVVANNNGPVQFFRFLK